MTYLAALLFSLCIALGASLFFWGGVWGGIYALRVQHRDLDGRIETLELRLQRESGRAGREKQTVARTRDEALAEQLARAAVASQQTRVPAPPQLSLPTDEDGLVIATPAQLADARRRAGK